MASESGTITILEDLFAWNSWANKRILRLCDGLTEDQLNLTRPMGFGSLRNTLFHILAAEEIWFERWVEAPWRSFSTDAETIGMAEIETRLSDISRRRAGLLENERTDGWSRIVHYKDGKGVAWSGCLKDLALHIANHGAHHRAQALNYLKSFGRTVPGGLDYLFYRFDRPFVRQEDGMAEQLRAHGLSMATGIGRELAWDDELIRQYFICGDWADDGLQPLIDELDDAALNCVWDMGPGTIRKTVLHILDAERWWLANWTTGPTNYIPAPETTSMSDFRADRAELRRQRQRFVESLTAASAGRVVTVLAGPMALRVPVIESLVQLCGHGTHHRAQLINMLRQTGVTAPQVDHIFWQRETGRAVPG